MKRWRRILSAGLVAILTFALMGTGLTGCFGGDSEPTLTLPAATVQGGSDIIEAGTLRVGVDSSKAPFAGTSGGKIIGIDVDIAAAVAEKMGLKVQIFDIKGQDSTTLLQNGTVDVVMSVVGTTGEQFSESKVGPYLVNGPAIFTVGHSETPMALDVSTLAGVQIAAQEKSLAAYRVSEELGDGNLVTYAKLDEVFAQLKSGAISYAAADAIVGSFLAIKQGNIRCEGILGQSEGIFMGVSTAKTNLVTKLTEALRGLRDDGSIQVIASKWLGPVSSQAVLNTASITAQASTTGSVGSATTTGASAAASTGTNATKPR